MPLRELIDLSINETLKRLGTSMTVFLASRCRWRCSAARPAPGDAVRPYRRHLILDTHCSPYPVVPGRASPATRGCTRARSRWPGRDPSATAAGWCHGAGASSRFEQNHNLVGGAKAGSPTDALARAFAPFLARHLSAADIAVSNVYGMAFRVCRPRRSRPAPPSAGSPLPSLPARPWVDRGADDLLRQMHCWGRWRRNRSQSCLRPQRRSRPGYRNPRGR